MIKSFNRESIESEKQLKLQKELTDNQMQTRQTSFLFDGLKNLYRTDWYCADHHFNGVFRTRWANEYRHDYVPCAAVQQCFSPDSLAASYL